MAGYFLKKINSFMFRSVITGTGSYIPSTIQSNADFANHTFYADNHQPLNAHREK